MKKTLISIAKLPDYIITKIYLKAFTEKNALLIFNFHGFFKNEEEKNKKLVDPQTWITIEEFHEFVKYFLKNDYKFISPDEIFKGLNEDKKYILVTFDDGYYNNTHVLPILKKYKIPAVLFTSTEQIKQNKCFWWDVLYREGKKNGLSTNKINNEQKLLKTKTNQEIEKYLIKKIGNNVLKPISDIDRPFTVEELKKFSEEKLITIGNHTNSHAILTNYSSDEIKSQIIQAQIDIKKITGEKPTIISYPNGNFSDEIIKISKENGIKLGITVEYKKNKLPIDIKEKNCMILGRFDLSGSKNIIRQCELFRSDILIYPKIKRILSRKTSK